MARNKIMSSLRANIQLFLLLLCFCFHSTLELFQGARSLARSTTHRARFLALWRRCECREQSQQVAYQAAGYWDARGAILVTYRHQEFALGPSSASEMADLASARTVWRERARERERERGKVVWFGLRRVGEEWRFHLNLVTLFVAFNRASCALAVCASVRARFLISERRANYTNLPSCNLPHALRANP